jgi:dihydrofolate synthase/folylpolyglutamate synthase
MPDVLPLSLARRGPSRIRPDLGALQTTLAALGSPQAGLRSALVVGTNGKGSTVAMLDAVLTAHGLRVGRFTSPHLVAVSERITVEGTPIAYDALSRLLGVVDRFDDLTFFETLTAVALLAFAEAGVDVAVLEAGMGGRWDATRAAASEIAGLTNVGTDHARWLGSTREAIAHDKGAALAAATIGVVGPGVDPALRTHLDAPDAVDAATLVRLDPVDDERCLVSWPGACVEVRVPLAGPHQRDNLHLALALARAAEDHGWLELDAANVHRALGRVVWPGRLSWHRIAGRRVLLDGAHNLEAVVALAATLEALSLRPHLVFSCLDDKPVEAMARVMTPVVESVTVCVLDDERAMPMDRLLAAFPAARAVPDPRQALARTPDPVLAAGSLRLVGTLLADAEVA